MCFTKKIIDNVGKYKKGGFINEKLKIGIKITIRFGVVLLF